MMHSLLRKLIFHGRLVAGAHKSGRVEPGGLFKVLPAHLWQSLPFSQLRHAFGEALHAGVEVRDDGEVDLSLQAGCGADGHTRTLALNAQMGFPHAGHHIPLLVLLWGYTRLGPPVTEILLGQVQTQGTTTQKCRRIRTMAWNVMSLTGFCILRFHEGSKT